MWHFLAGLFGKKKPAVGFKFKVSVNGKAKWLEDGMAVLITLDQKLPMQAVPIDASGNPAKIDGNVTWSLSDPAYGTLQIASPDMSSAIFVPAMTGLVQVIARATAAANPISGSLDVQTEAGVAVSIRILPGTPVPK